MQAVLDVDERLLSLAEQQARREGKSMGALVEDALRLLLRTPQPLPIPSELEGDSVEADEPFFAALDEIRALGRLPAAHRRVNLH